jgi:hypothetical protein
MTRAREGRSFFPLLMRFFCYKNCSFLGTNYEENGVNYEENGVNYEENGVNYEKVIHNS